MTNYSQSDKLFAHGQQFIPDGVSSPMRAFPLVDGTLSVLLQQGVRVLPMSTATIT